MNYEQARQIGSTGPAPGKWNWSNFNDGIADHPYTVPPCRAPEPGRERCDHDTQEDAERHFYEYQRSNLREVEMSGVQHVCEIDGCDRWTSKFLETTAGPIGPLADLCDEHRNIDGWTAVHPFVPGMQVIHS